MVVGDELQSIYGFRHADLDVFRERRRAVEESADAEAIDAERQLPLAPGGDRRGQRDRREAARRRLPSAAGRRAATGAASRPARAPPVELLLTARDGWDAEGIELAPAIDADTPPNHLAEARFLAERLRELADKRGRARRDGRAAARLHPPRRLRGLAGARRPAPLRRRRPRLLVPAAGRRRLRAAGDDRQPARRPGAVRRTRLARLRRRPRHALAAARGSGPAAATSGRRSSRRPASARPSCADAERLEQIPETELALLRDFARTIDGTARPRRAPLARRPDRRRGDRDRLRPRGADAPRRARPASPTCAS